jgi:type I restriction enzyme S subunit
MSWQKIKFGELVAKSQHGGTPSTKRADFWGGGEIPWITGADFAGQKVANIRRYITGEAVRSSSTSVVPQGDFLLVTRTGVGKMAIAPFDVAISQDITGIRFKNNVSPEFMLYKLASESARMVNLKQGTSISGIKQKDLADLEINLPIDRIEQSRIAEILTKADEAIEATERLIAKYSRIKMGLMQDLLTRGIDKDGNIRNPKSHKFTTKNGLDVPDDWDVEPLESYLIEIEAGKSPRNENRPAGASEWGVLKVSAIHPNGFKPLENKVVSKAVDINRAYEVKHRDLLISRSNTFQLVGLTCFVQHPPARLMICDKTLRLKLDESILDANFFSYASQMPSFRSQIEVSASGSSGTMKNITQKAIASIFISKPDIDEQKRIQTRLKILENAINFESARLQKIFRIKAGLMQDLLSGRKRVKFSED